MSDILQRLQGKTELCKALGVTIIDHWHAILWRRAEYGFDLNNDDCPGSALLVSRCLDWLKQYNAPKKFRPALWASWPESESDMWTLSNLCDEDGFYSGPTRVLAALTAVLEVEEGK